MKIPPYETLWFDSKPFDSFIFQYRRLSFTNQLRWFQFRPTFPFGMDCSSKQKSWSEPKQGKIPIGFGSLKINPLEAMERKGLFPKESAFDGFIE